MSGRKGAYGASTTLASACLKGCAYMSLEKSETFDAVNLIAAHDAAPMIETAAARPNPEPREPPRKRYAAPSAPRVLQCMQPAGAAGRTPREKA
jgi:hypothetical protein